jgi:hypothetical protein
MPTNERNGVEACLSNDVVRDILLNHHKDATKVRAALQSAGIVFRSDTERDAAVGHIAKINCNNC